jgi:hypothetical protein
MRKKTRKLTKPWRGTVVLTALFLLAATAPSDFLAQRRQFRDEIKNKMETKLDQKGNFLSVIFKGEEGKYHFGITPADRDRLKKHISAFSGPATNP